LPFSKRPKGRPTTTKGNGRRQSHLCRLLAKKADQQQQQATVAGSLTCVAL